MRRLYLIALLLGGACSASDDIPAPLVSSVQPDHASGGAVVTVSGSYFCQRPDNGQEDPLCDSVGEVDFGAAPGSISLWTDTAVMVEVPQGITGAVQVDVIAAGRPSNSVTFTGD